MTTPEFDPLDALAVSSNPNTGVAVNGTVPAITPSTEKKGDINDIVKQVFSGDYLTAKSVLNAKQIAAVAAAMAYADMYKCDDTKMLVINLLNLQISFLGTGRKNLVTILSSMLQREPEEPKQRNLINRLFGLGR